MRLFKRFRRNKEPVGMAILLCNEYFTVYSRLGRWKAGTTSMRGREIVLNGWRVPDDMIARGWMVIEDDLPVEASENLLWVPPLSPSPRKTFVTDDGVLYRKPYPDYLDPEANG